MDTAFGLLFCLLLGHTFSSCDRKEDTLMTELETTEEEEPVIVADAQVVVTKVAASGGSGSYTFQVTLASPDLGCSQYADWWEVLTPDSTLIYRRILTHSHVNEQPFTRSGGPVNIEPEAEVLVRGHMNNLGYGQIAFRGSVANGFVADTLSTAYASGLAATDPLPQGCAF